MWKWLRNIVLLAIVLAGALKLGAWYAVGHDAQRVVDALAPYAEIKYEGLAARLDGSVTITGVSVAPKGAHRVYRADSVAFDSPGLFWLLKHALLHENDLPAQFGLGVTGLSLAPEPWLDPLWLDPATFTVFASAGCESRLGSSDYRRMELDPTTPSRQRFEYRYDASQHTLTATLSLSAPGFATLAPEADFSRFERVMGEDFTMVVPTGQLLDRAAVLGYVKASRGTFDGDFAISIEDIRPGWQSGDVIVLTYVEAQQRAGQASRRRSSTIFTVSSSAPNGVEWRHLHETWLQVPGS